MPDPRKMKAAAKRAADRRKNEKRFEGTPDTAETQFEAMQASKAKEMKHTVAQRGKYANPSSRSPAAKVVDLVKFAVTKPKTFSHFHIWGGIGGRSPNMIGGMERASKLDLERRQKNQRKRVLSGNKTGMSNTPETRFEAAPPPLSRQGMSGVTKRGRSNRGREKGWQYK